MSSKYTPTLYCVKCGELIKDNICTNCHQQYKKCNDIPCLIINEFTDSDLLNRYYANYTIIAKDDIAKDMMPLSYKQAQAKKMIKYIGKIKNKNILDVGAGKGLLLGMIDDENNKVAIDIAMDYLVLLKKSGFYAIMANAENLPFKNEFDLIIMVDILEHVLNAEKALNCVRQALKEGGVVIIRVPFKEDLSKYSAAAGCKYEFVHLRSFDKDNMNCLLNKCRLHPIRFYHDGYTLDKARLLIKLPAALCIYVLSIIELIFKHPHNNIRNIQSSKELAIGQINNLISSLPNWLAIIFFQPIEIVVVASVLYYDKP